MSAIRRSTHITRSFDSRLSIIFAKFFRRTSMLFDRRSLYIKRCDARCQHLINADRKTTFHAFHLSLQLWNAHTHTLCHMFVHVDIEYISYIIFIVEKRTLPAFIQMGHAGYIRYCRPAFAASKVHTTLLYAECLSC